MCMAPLFHPEVFAFCNLTFDLAGGGGGVLAEKANRLGRLHFHIQGSFSEKERGSEEAEDDLSFSGEDRSP